MIHYNSENKSFEFCADDLAVGRGFSALSGNAALSFPVRFNATSSPLTVTFLTPSSAYLSVISRVSNAFSPAKFSSNDQIIFGNDFLHIGKSKRALPLGTEDDVLFYYDFFMLFACFLARTRIYSTAHETSPRPQYAMTFANFSK